MLSEIRDKARDILERLRGDSQLSQYVDWSLQPPEAYRGADEIKLIVLGQDPTVKDVESRKLIKTVLNLDKKQSVCVYLTSICNGLGINLNRDVYATNLYKNFFVAPPTQIKAVNIFEAFAEMWLPLLLEELSPFRQVSVITLGEPILARLVGPGVPAQVKQYWGYKPNWKMGSSIDLRYIKPHENHRDRLIFPFPHQPSLRNGFYKAKLKDYVSFMKDKFSDNTLMKGGLTIRATASRPGGGLEQTRQATAGPLVLRAAVRCK